MISTKKFQELALSFPQAEEQPHFQKTSFRVKKKIFATLTESEAIASIKLSEIDQSAFCSHHTELMYPVPNKWGKKGWTFINLEKIEEEMLLDALTNAYCETAPKELSKKLTEERKRL